MLTTLTAYYFGLFFTVGLLLIGALWLFSPRSRPMAAGLFYLYFTEIFIVGGIVVPALLGETAFLIVMILLALRALYEFYTAVPSSPFFAIRLAGLAGGGLWLVAGAFLPLNLFPAAVGASLLILLIVYLATPIAATSAESVAHAVSGWLYPIGCFVCLLAVARSNEGLLWIVFAYAVLETQDTIALLVGKLFGRTKIFPQLSPNKTWAGVGWGAAGGLAVGLILGIYRLDWSWPQAVGVSLVVVICTLLGDLVASKFKRDRQIKDFSPLIKNQGGVLDIYDSLLFAAPAIYLYILASGV